MKIPKHLPQFTDAPALIAVVSREHGILYYAIDGSVERIAAVNEPHPRYSDREGFFMRQTGGTQLGSGAPYEDDGSEDHKRFIGHVVEELRTAMAKHSVKHLYLFEPEYLKGQVAEAMRGKESISVTLVDFGNFIQSEPLELLEKINTHENPPYDPSDPASVVGEKNAEEKRKILKLGKRLEE